MLAKIEDLNQKVVLAVLVAVSLALVWLANRHGVGWSYDSADYVAVGSSLSRGFGALDVIGKPTTVHPPGFSMMIAIGLWLGFSSSMALLGINMISTVVSVVCTFALLRRATQRLLYAIVGTLFVVAAPALMWQYSMAYSEPLFMSLEMAMIVVVLHAKSYWKYVLLTLLSTALFYVRYVGPVFTGIIMLMSFVFDVRIRGLMKSILLNGAVVVGSSVPTWLLLAHNKQVDGTTLGFMQGGGGSFWKAFTMLPGTLGEWIAGSPPKIELLSWSVHPTLPKVATICLLVFVVPLAIVAIVDRWKDGTRLQSSQFLLFVMMSAVTVGYCMFSVYRFVRVHRASLDDRVMIPVYIPVVIILVIVIERAMLGRPFIGSVVRVGIGALLLFQTMTTIGQAWTHGRDGRYLTSREVHDWPIHKFVRSLPRGGRYFSNEMQTLFASTDIWPIGNPWMGDEQPLVACNHRYVVWYNGSTVTDNKPDSLSRTLYEDSMGSVFDVGPCGTDINLFWN